MEKISIKVGVKPEELQTRINRLATLEIKINELCYDSIMTVIQQSTGLSAETLKTMLEIANESYKNLYTIVAATKTYLTSVMNTRVAQDQKQGKI